jgi:phosphate transport system substrate-binding protein
VTKWSQLGIKIPGCENDEIVRLSRQNNSGTYEYFKEAVLGKEVGYKLGTIDASGSKDLVKQVANSPCAIGYSGMGYKTPDVKVLKVKKANGTAVLPSVEAVHDKTYPISRPLFMFTLGQPQGAVADYLAWVRGPGQDIVTKIGYVPLSAVDLAPVSASEKR